MQRNQLKAVILTTLHSTEYNAVRSYLSERREIVIRQGNVYDQGIFSASEIIWDILLGQIKIGNIESAIEAERAISYFQPDVILSIGLAHGFKDVQIGDVVAATKVYGYEYGKETREGFQTRPEVNQSTHSMIQRALAEERNADWQRLLPIINAGHVVPKVFIGPLAAGEKEVTSSSKFWQFLENHYNDTLAIDTSSFGFLGATHATSRIEALIIRGIASTRSDVGSSASTQKAAHHVSTFAFMILSKLTRRQFSQYEVPLADPLLQLEQLAYGNASAVFPSGNDRNITLYPATSAIPSSSMSDSSKKALELFNKGNQDFQQRMYKVAVKSYNESLRLNKSNPEVYNNKGVAHFHLGEYAKALEAYTSAIDSNPSYAEAYSNRAAVHHKLGAYREAQASYQLAINLYSHVIAKEPDEMQRSVLQKHLASALTGLGDALYELRDRKKARTYYTRALGLEPCKASAYVGRGNCYVQQERFKEALADYRQAIKYDPNNPAAYKGQSDAYQGSKQWEKAIESCGQALLFKSNEAAKIYRTKGIAHSWLEEYQQALEAFNAFRRLSPDDILSYKYVVATLEKLQCYEEVLKVCKEASQRFLGDDWISTRQQKALFELARLHQCIEEQDTAILPVISRNQVK